MKFGSTLTLIFVAAKLLGLVKWSWWLVFLPAAFSLVLSFALLLIYTALNAATAWFTIQEKRKACL